MNGRAGVWAALAFALSACAASPAPWTGEHGWEPVTISTQPTALGAVHVGALKFVGGIELHSSAAAFGGLSDIAVQPNGDFLAVSDGGVFVRGHIESDAAGAPIGITHGELTQLRDEHGLLFDADDGDSEGMTILPDGRVAVSFEGRQSIMFYDLNHPLAPAQLGPPLAGAERLAANLGLEALATMADGRLIVGAESVGGEGLIWTPALDARAPTPPVAHYPLDVGFGLTEFDRLPDGDFVALERFYAPLIGVRIRVSRLSAAALQSGQARKAELALLGAGLAIDNFEGISVVPQANGGVRLYLVSDDNYSPRQRTLIYVFDLEEQRP